MTAELDVPPELDRVQGNILRPFARSHAVYLFFRVTERATNARAVVRELAKEYVTSAATQCHLSRQFRRKGISASGVGMFGLSALGYRSLDLGSYCPNDVELGAEEFNGGMRNPSYTWMHEEFKLWEEQYGKGIDGFMLLADSSQTRLNETVDSVRQRLREVSFVHSECGRRLRKPGADWDVEHYGYREGISGHPDPAAVFIRDPGMDEMSRGCFAAFIKLEQNAARFNVVSDAILTKMKAASELRCPFNIEDIQNHAVGRRRTGEPLVAVRNGDIDEFSFQNVPPEVCPAHAHIRVMNERDGSPQRLILRRGLSYGPERLDWTGAAQPAPETGSGLLFLSFQSSLYDFLTLIRKAQNRRDPMLVRAKGWEAGGEPDVHTGQEWHYGPGQAVSSPMVDLTTVKGGEYFYIPGMPFIRSVL